MKQIMILAVVTLIAPPSLAQEVVSLGRNLNTGLEEIRVDLPGLPQGVKPLEMVLIPAGTFTMGAAPEETVPDADGDAAAGVAVPTAPDDSRVLAA